MAVSLALIGKSGAGKSEVSRHLAEVHGFTVVRTGTICRRIAKILFDNEDKATTQRLDDALTPLDPCIFLRASLRHADFSQDLVVDSLRFAADLRFSQSLGFLTLRVKSDTAARLARLAARGQAFDAIKDALHRSEVELDPFGADFEISNEGSLSELKSAVDAIVQNMR